MKVSGVVTGVLVAIGIALDMIYARKMNYIDAESAERVLSLLETLGYALYANELLHEDSDGNLMVIQGLEEFREHLGGELTITLLEEIGKGFEVHEVSLPKAIEAIYELKERHLARGQKVVQAFG